MVSTCIYIYIYICVFFIYGFYTCMLVCLLYNWGWKQCACSSCKCVRKFPTLVQRHACNPECETFYKREPRLDFHDQVSGLLIQGRWHKTAFGMATSFHGRTWHRTWRCIYKRVYSCQSDGRFLEILASGIKIRRAAEKYCWRERKLCCVRQCWKCTWTSSPFLRGPVSIAHSNFLILRPNFTIWCMCRGILKCRSLRRERMIKFCPQHVFRRKWRKTQLVARAE